MTSESYLLNSIFTHKSARYAFESALYGFATDAAINALPNSNVIMISERNSEALNAPDNAEYGSVVQDDYDTWVGESALVKWGRGNYRDQGWYNRHGRGANYIYTDYWPCRRPIIDKTLAPIDFLDSSCWVLEQNRNEPER